jgi:hypothetical protein
MADETVDIRFVSEQLKRVLDQLGTMQGSISEIQVAIGAIRTDQGRTNELLEQVRKTQQNHGARLNAIDGRLAIIEERVGLVKA